MNKIHVFSFASYQARYFFQQLISGVFYCHSMVINTKIFRVISVSFLCLVLTFPLIYFVLKQICHRDLKLENTLLDGSPAPRLKICDFGYSKV